MEHFDTADGDDIRVERVDGAQALTGEFSLAVDADFAAGGVAGVLTSSAHADAIHDLFRRGTVFRIVVRPADADESRCFELCQFLSSSGKWTTEK